MLNTGISNMFYFQNLSICVTNHLSLCPIIVASCFVYNIH